MPSPEQSRSSTGAAFARIEVRARGPAAAERAVAEAMEAGAAGLEEREVQGGIRLLIYASAAGMEAVQRALLERCGGEVEVGAPETLPETDWSEAWKAGLEAVVVSRRLRVRPPFVKATAEPEQAEIVIDPGQAFGTGGHASTLLALEWLDAVAPGLTPGSRILDVGAGSGILALAALRLGRGTAVAFDLDPLAAAASRGNAIANGLEGRLQVFTGPLEALRLTAFDLVLANLLKTELLPLVQGITARTAPGGHAVFSGLLEGERQTVVQALHAAGLRLLATRQREDASGERWISLLMTR
jgi:ribosomal protein L11 methyltransferase